MRSFDKASTYDELCYYEKMLTDYSAMLFTKGLTVDDYTEISKIIKRLMFIKNADYYEWREYVRLKGYVLKTDAKEAEKEEYIRNRDRKKENLDNVEALLGGYVKISEMLRKSVVPRTLKGFLTDECSLVHLAFTNDTGAAKVSSFGYGSFAFLCQFHIEHNPSMIVNNTQGLLHCYGCGTSLNLISYFMEVEKVSYQEAVNLLAKIYMIDMKNEIYTDGHPLVTKYRSSLLDGDYASILTAGKEKMARKEDNWLKEETNKKLEHDLSTIIRVRDGGHIKYSGKKPDCKRLILEMPSWMKEGE